MTDGINNQNNGQGEGNQNTNTGANNANAANQNNGQGFEFDYEKLASIVTGAQSVKEDAVLKNYFKQQGLSQEEMNQAISKFKEQKQANTPDVTEMQRQLQEAQAAALNEKLNNNLQIAALKCSVDIASLPYVLKLVDRAALTAESKEEDFVAAVNKVLEAVPAFKKENAGSQGFQQVGAGGTTSGTTPQQEALKKIFGN